ncbi:MAG: DUF1566 domain-containing protein [Bacteroidales bacterium]|jgi:hypothetical protein|nr:DUF1566 domain-containing protein [Bacteroidales bacterium]
MKKVTLFLVLSICILGCEDSYYTDGRITTYDATEITAQSALLKGNIEINTNGGYTTLLRRGFVYSTDPSKLSAFTENLCGMVYDDLSNEGNFQMSAMNLMPNTKYYCKAFVVLENSYSDNVEIYYYNGQLSGNHTDKPYVFYGNQIEFTTADGVVQNFITMPEQRIMVQKTDLGSADWNTAVTMCSNSNVGGYSDWRLPTLAELQYLYTNRTTIGGFSSTWYWSSTSTGSYHYAVDFSDGYYDYWSGGSRQVRAVRSY